MVATSAPQVARLHEGVARRRAFGMGEDDLRLLEPAELDERVRVRGARAASYTPHCGRVDPARLARGLALACERRGVDDLRAHGRRGRSSRAACAARAASLRADSVLRATEAFTVQQPGRAPALHAALLADGRDRAAAGRRLGGARLGGPRDGLRSAPPLLLRAAHARRPHRDRRPRCARTASARRSTSPTSATTACAPDSCARSRSAFPAAACAAITHHWGGPLGVPRDWCCSVHYDPATGFGWAGGYTGHGVVTSNVLGRTLADLVLRRDTRPRVAALGRAREPALGARAAALPRLASDRGARSAAPTASRTGSDRPAWRTRLVRPFMQVR